MPTKINEALSAAMAQHGRDVVLQAIARAAEDRQHRTIIGQRMSEQRRQIQIRHVRERRNWLLPFVTVTHPDYLVGEFHRRLCSALVRFSEGVARGESPRLIIVAPPRHGKTEIVSRRFPVAHMARNPGHTVICASYAAELARANSRAARAIARSREVAEIWPGLKVGEQVGTDTPDTVDHWGMTGGGIYHAAGIGGSMTGFGANLLVIDDPFKNAQEAESAARRELVWNEYLSSATTRLAPGGGVIIMATRWHDDDLTGRLLAAMERGDGDRFEVLHFEAISTGQVLGDWRRPGEALHEERYGAAVLEQRRQVMGASRFEALYQGRPVADGGGAFRASLWRRYTGHPKIIAKQAIEVALTVDCANEANDEACYSVFHVVGRFQTAEGPRVRVLAEYRGQWELPALIDTLKRALSEWPSIGPVYIEYAANGIGLVQVARQFRAGVVPVKPRGDETYPGGSKETRAQFTLTGLESGVGPELPEDAHALNEAGENFAVGIINEHARFPAGKLKDRVDTLSQYMIRVLVTSQVGSVDIATRARMFGL